MKHYNPNMDGSRILLGGHRGDKTNYPENTMSAFRSSLEMGIDAIETDVRMTCDGVLVLIHDRDVVRTTDGEGFVDEMTLEELRRLDAGSWKGEKFAGERIPTVVELLELVKDSQMIINWELKEYPVDHGDARAFETVDRLMELLEQYGMVERSMLNSFSDRLLEYAEGKWGDRIVLHGYLHYKSPKDHAQCVMTDILDWAAIWNKTEECSVGFDADYEELNAHGILPCILVEDREEEYRKALDKGCRMFTSNDPASALAILKALGVK